MSLWKYLGPVGAIGTAITGNQAKQKRKGAIGAAYRVNAARMDLDQADTRQSTNESLNARGVLTAGGVQTAGSDIADRSSCGVRRSKVRKPRSLRGCCGPQCHRTCEHAFGAANAALTDQFALERKELADNKAAMEKENRAEYLGSIGHAIEEGIDTTVDAFGANLQTEPQSVSESRSSTARHADHAVSTDWSLWHADRALTSPSRRRRSARRPRSARRTLPTTLSERPDASISRAARRNKRFRGDDARHSTDHRRRLDHRLGVARLRK
jgi:hypothetical protein